MSKKLRLLALSITFMLFGGLAIAPVAAGPKGKHSPPGLAKKGHVPPGLAKKRGCLPPGLAKKAGAHSRCQMYMAVDPRFDDRAWFLLEGAWVLRDLDDLAKRDLRAQLAVQVASPPPPGTPLPKVAVELKLMWFGD